MNIIQRAAWVANTLHKGQKRAGGEPYINHPMRVAGAVTLLGDTTEDMIVAAWLHDVYEDTNYPLTALENAFGHKADQLVAELTSAFTSKVFPDMPRKVRKVAEIKRLARISPQGQIIKLCDRIDNLRTIRAKGREFALLYCDESDALAEAMTASPLRGEIFKLTKEIRANE